MKHLTAAQALIIAQSVRPSTGLPNLPEIIETWDDGTYKCIWLNPEYTGHPEDDRPAELKIVESIGWQEPGEFNHIFEAPNGYTIWNIDWTEDAEENDIVSYRNSCLDEDPMGRHYGFNI